MTGPCSGTGVGTPKAGFTAIQYIGPGAIGGALAGLSGWRGAAMGAAIGALTFDLTTFCPGGPPAMPTFTAGDIIALLAPLPTAARATAALKFADFLGNVFWPLLCDCSSGTSVIGAPSTYPSGAPAAVTVSTETGYCKRSVATPTALANGNAIIHGGAYWDGLPATAIRFTLGNTVVTGAGSTLQIDVEFMYHLNGTFTALNSFTTTRSPGVSTTFDVSVPPQATETRITITGIAGTGTSTGVVVHEIYCGAIPGAAKESCCPPDPATQATLDHLLRMVTLIQRQAAPFAYVYGTNHATLSGNGSLAVSGLLGVSVDVTTIPASYGRADGTPVEYFDLGYVTLGTADGYEVSRRIDHDGTLVLPPSAGAFTAIGYTLEPGVVVSIRELVREP